MFMFIFSSCIFFVTVYMIKIDPTVWVVAKLSSGKEAVILACDDVMKLFSTKVCIYNYTLLIMYEVTYKATSH